MERIPTKECLKIARGMSFNGPEAVIFFQHFDSLVDIVTDDPVLVNAEMR